MYSCQVSCTSHVMLTLTHRLDSGLFLVLETHLSLPKALWTLLLWNQIPHLTHILGPHPTFPVLWNVLLFTLVFYSNPGRKYRHKLRFGPVFSWPQNLMILSFPVNPLGFHLNNYSDLKTDHIISSLTSLEPPEYPSKVTNPRRTLA